MNRRRFVAGLAGILASAQAPAIITTPGLLMPVRNIWAPRWAGIDLAGGRDRSADVQLIERLKWTRDDIARTFRVPRIEDIELNCPDGGTVIFRCFWEPRRLP